MGKLLKKGDVFVLEHGPLAGEYVVSCVEETAISIISPIYESRAWCLQVENPEKGISFYQSDKYTPCIGDIKVIGHATQATPGKGKWNIKYFDKKESVADTTDEKMENKKTSDFDYAEIMKDAIDEVVKNAIESTAHKIIKEFREGIKKVIGN